MTKRPKPSTNITSTPTPEMPLAAEAHHDTSLTAKLQDIRTDALRDRSRTSEIIARLHAEREQLDQMRNEIDSTIAFLRAQRNK